MTKGRFEMDEWVALANLLEREYAALLAEWRQKVRDLPSARQLPAPALNDHVPLLVSELIEALRHPERSDPVKSIINRASVDHGTQRAHSGYEIGEVVAEYSMLRSCIHTLAEIHGVPLRDGQVQLLNSVLDSAIGASVRAFAQHCEEVERKRRDEHLAFVAHDLRTPLNAVVLASRALEQNGQQPDDRARMLDVLKRNVRQLAALVDSVLQNNRAALARGRDEPQRRQFQLWPLVQQLIAEMQPTIDFAATGLRNEVPEDLMVFADADMLRRTLQNLICEALLRRPGARISVAAGLLAGAGDGADGSRTGAWCEVRNNGTERVAASPPLSAAEASDPLPEDSPNGLAIVRILLASHGSVLDEDTDQPAAAGSGSVFRFQLPGDGGT